MHLIRGLQNWPDDVDTALTIGNFDGCHLGHQEMFTSLTSVATERSLTSTVISFEPLPSEYFTPRTAPARLQGLRDRHLSLCSAGIDRFLLLRFDERLASLSADDFVHHILVDRLRARHIMVGDDFRFGHRRDGSFHLLRSVAARFGFTLHQSPTCLAGGERISSTRIRQHLDQGELDEAAMLLGRPYRITGRVIHGDKRGRQLGFPTANIALGRHRPALRGVFSARVHDLSTERTHPAVVNLGERPTVGGHRLLLEAHLLDIDADLYGHHLAVDFVDRIRHEQRFASLEELRDQIRQDAAAARERLCRR